MDGMGVDVLQRGVCGIAFKLDLSKQILHGGFVHITQIPLSSSSSSSFLVLPPFSISSSSVLNIHL
jgi:hypothetical protein